jgi:hypothetical protein
MSTLGRIHNIDARQDFFPEMPKPENVNILWDFHSDIRELNTELAAKFEDSSVIYKQHIFPTENNINLLKGVKKVILLRDVEEIIEAYYRGFASGVHDKHPVFKGSNEDWLSKAKDSGLYDDLQNFYEKWQNLQEDKLTIHYKQLIENPAVVINSIEEYWSLPITEGTITLDKKRYSRLSPAEAFIKYKFIGKPWRKLKKIIRSILKFNFLSCLLPVWYPFLLNLLNSYS